ncbi:MAG TPA: T9SS type A sorting domain-containing protein [Chitinophagaceae bacterium]|nr:T9SS type A sorting domain-containing protein [Chitinophagaceae bacterium]
MKRLIPILSVLFLTTARAAAQSHGNAGQEPAERIVKFYPNPATSFINFDIQRNTEKGYSLQVFNFLGKQVYEVRNLSARTTVDLSEYTRGIYIYQLRDLSGKILESGKFQVAK